MKGWVYVMSNLAMQGIVKIGFSTKDPILRAKELEGTGLPHRFIVEYSMLVDEPYKVEQYIHNHLSYCHENKEFFRIEATKAISTLKECTSLLGQTIHFDIISNREQSNYDASDKGSSRELTNFDLLDQDESRKLKSICSRILNNDSTVFDGLWGIIKDYEQEVNYWALDEIVNSLESINKGSAEIEFILGYIYNNDDEFCFFYNAEKAFNMLRSAAMQNHREAAFYLGEIYRRGSSFVSIDLKEAIKWLHVAAENFNIRAQSSLDFLERGLPKPVRDVKETILWYKKAVELSTGKDEESAYDGLEKLSRIYNDNEVMVEHRQLIEEWFINLLRQGKYLEARFFDERKVLFNSGGYIKTLEIAAASGKVGLYKLLSDIYKFGLYGVEEDINLSKMWQSKFLTAEA